MAVQGTATTRGPSTAISLGMEVPFLLLQRGRRLILP